MQYGNRSEASREPQPLVWWSHAQLDQLAAQLLPLWTGWARDWLAAVDPGQVVTGCRHASGAEASLAWSLLGRGGGGAAAWTDGADALRPFALAGDDDHPGEAGGTTRSRPIARAVDRQSQSAWSESIGSHLGLDPDAANGLPPAPLFKPWSGAVVLSFEARGKLAQRLLLNGAAARCLLAQGPAAGEQRTALARGGLVPVLTALGHRPIRLRVELEAREIDLGSLCGLTEGDVVPLPHPLEAPLALSCDGVRVCTAYLGRKGKSLAVELTPEAAAADATESHQA